MLNGRSVKQRIAETENVFYNMKKEFWQLTSATRNNKKRRVRELVAESVKDTIDWKTLLTTIVENLHAVSRFKHETFDPLQYATDFGTISKKSFKRITKWGTKLYTYIFIPSSATDFQYVLHQNLIFNFLEQ